MSVNMRIVGGINLIHYFTVTEKQQYHMRLADYEIFGLSKFLESVVISDYPEV